MLGRSMKLGLTLLASAAAIPASAAVVNVDALDSVGSSVLLGPGTYHVNYAALFGPATYRAFSYWPNTTGCNASGGDCDRGWSNHFAIDLGGGIGTGYGIATVGGIRGVFDTEQRALEQFSTQTLQSATLAQINNDRNYFMAGGNAYTDVAGPISFTLAAAQSVRFFIIDQPHSDNRGGVSLRVVAVPEPATWAMMIAGFGLIGFALRQRRGRALQTA